MTDSSMWVVVYAKSISCFSDFRYLEDRLEEEQLMRSLVEMVLGGRENAKEAKKKLVQYKAKIVQEVNEESKELMRQALEEVS